MKVTDPICGMQIDSERAAARHDYGGRTYFFCSAHCHRLFEENPERYGGQKRKPGETSGPAAERERRRS